MKPIFFSSASAFREWLEAHHATESELLVGLWTKSSGRPGMSYPEALDEALCFGWIDGVRRKVDANSFSTRFTPRKPRSRWSLVNVRHVQRLIAAGRMRPPGLKAFEARDEKKTGTYSFEKRPASFPPDLEKIFRADKAAWAFWNDQPPGYRRTATWWVVSAVRDETRLRRLGTLIKDSARLKRLDLLI
jgi:uncharacterized protein YdeI (YjbR/CyaY-like superfamily)